jgi:hypothetical protein
MNFSLSPVFESGKYVCDSNDDVVIEKHENIYIYGKRIHLHSNTTVKTLCDKFGTCTIQYLSPPRIKLLEIIPRTMVTFPKFKRKEFMCMFNIPSKYKYISPNKHAILEIENEPLFNPTPFQRCERSKLPYFRGSCTFWCLWYIEYRERNNLYSRELLERYALFRLRKYASEYLSWWISLRLHL